jgi:4-hydroxy-tetrahydrodipicolinate synthase
MARGLKPGVHCISATPSLPDESLDLASLKTLLDYLATGGCAGALVLGVLGEADRLDDDERRRVLATALDYAGDRLQISVGVTHASTVVTRRRALEAQEQGVASVMISPPSGSAAGPALREHFKRIAADLTIPLIVQDHPTSSGVRMPVEFIASLYELLPPGSVCKLEDPPTPVKMNRLRELEPGYQIFGGLGGVSLLHELDAGSAGAMTGFAVVDMLVEIVSAYQRGDRAAAVAAYDRALPLMVFEAQPGAGVALRKEILKRRGAIAHATVRQPAPIPDAFALGLLDDLMSSLSVAVPS